MILNVFPGITYTTALFIPEEKRDLALVYEAGMMWFLSRVDEEPGDAVTLMTASEECIPQA